MSVSQLNKSKQYKKITVHGVFPLCILARTFWCVNFISSSTYAIALKLCKSLGLYLFRTYQLLFGAKQIYTDWFAMFSFSAGVPAAGAWGFFFFCVPLEAFCVMTEEVPPMGHLTDIKSTYSTDDSCDQNLSMHPCQRLITARKEK